MDRFPVDLDLEIDPETASLTTLWDLVSPPADMDMNMNMDDDNADEVHDQTTPHGVAGNAAAAWDPNFDCGAGLGSLNDDMGGFGLLSINDISFFPQELLTNAVPTTDQIAVQSNTTCDNNNNNNNNSSNNNNNNHNTITGLDPYADDDADDDDDDDSRSGSDCCSSTSTSTSSSDRDHEDETSCIQRKLQQISTRAEGLAFCNQLLKQPGVELPLPGSRSARGHFHFRALALGMDSTTAAGIRQLFGRLGLRRFEALYKKERRRHLNNGIQRRRSYERKKTSLHLVATNDALKRAVHAVSQQALALRALGRRHRCVVA